MPKIQSPELKKTKYQQGDCIGFFEELYYIYGFNQPFLRVAKNVDGGALEELTPEQFLEEYKINESGWYRWGFPSEDLISMGCDRQLYHATKETSGAFPLTLWEYK